MALPQRAIESSYPGMYFFMNAARSMVDACPYPIFDIQTSVLPQGCVKLLIDMAYGVDITDARDLTRAEIAIRKEQIPGILRFLKNYLPGFEESNLIDTSPLIGTRESRLIKGIYTITEDDIHSNRRGGRNGGGPLFSRRRRAEVPGYRASAADAPGAGREPRK